MVNSLDQASGKKSSNFIIGAFLAVWLCLNLLQAAFMELHSDEAYYWLYSRFLDWGYFDHPPMVALYIKAGDSLSHSLLGLRLTTLISTTAAIYILWLIVKQYAENAKLFVMVFSCFLLFHVYGFITTPDSPLFFFSVLFFYLYKKYAEKDSWTLAVLLATVIALMLYSKYHGVLILFFTILSNLKLLTRKSFWAIVALSLVFYVPHIAWQVSNGFPSVNYHLFDRSPEPYAFTNTTDYILSQILIAGPLVGWFFLKSSMQVKATDGFIRTLKFNFAGIFLFFLFSTLKDEVQGHWTLIAYPSLFILSYLYLARLEQIPAWFKKLILVNIALILIVRAVFIFPIPALQQLSIVKKQTGSRLWAQQIKEKAGDAYVIFDEGFQEPSKYDYYNNTIKGFAYDSRYYRKTQFDIWPIEDSLRNKRVYYTHQASFADVKQDSFQTVKGTYYGIWIDQVRLYQKVEIKPEQYTKNWNVNETRDLNLKIYNPYGEEINFSNEDEPWKCYLEYGYLKDGELVEVHPVTGRFHSLKVGPKQEAELRVPVKAPSKPGKYKLIFSIRTDPFPGARNSPMLQMNTK